MMITCDLSDTNLARATVKVQFGSLLKQENNRDNSTCILTYFITKYLVVIACHFEKEYTITMQKNNKETAFKQRQI